MGKIKIIAAIGKNRELGKNNNLIWSFKEDMKFFKENTINHKIVMGLNTFNSLPSLLKNREHIVLSYEKIDIDNVKVFTDFQELLNFIKNLEEDVFIIGGGLIYNLFIEYCDELLLTEIEADCLEADVFFPEFNKDNFYREVLSENEEKGIKYNFVKYRRI